MTIYILRQDRNCTMLGIPWYISVIVVSILVMDIIFLLGFCWAYRWN